MPRRTFGDKVRAKGSHGAKHGKARVINHDGTLTFEGQSQWVRGLLISLKPSFNRDQPSRLSTAVLQWPLSLPEAHAILAELRHRPSQLIELAHPAWLETFQVRRKAIRPYDTVLLARLALCTELWGTHRLQQALVAEAAEQPAA